MKDEIPCKNCIAYAMCRARMLPYLQDFRHITKQDAVVAYLQNIGDRCPEATNYVIAQRKKSVEGMVVTVFRTLQEMFSEQS